MRRLSLKTIIGLGMVLASGALPPVHAAERAFYIVTVHHDGKTSVRGDATHSPERFPDEPFASSRGMWAKEPAANGEWTVRAFVFDPAEVTVQQGDEVRLHFVGVHGVSHAIVVEGIAQPVTVTRGREQVVAFKAERPGIITFICKDHPPSMRGQVVVLPRA